jgi:Uma2 family endonuclease
MWVPGSFEEHVRPLRRVEYDRLVELGLFDQEKLELLNGFIVRMSPQGVRHASIIQALTRLFMAALLTPRRAEVRVQLPLALGDDSEPEPDIAIVPPGPYKDEHPTTALLVIEVADSSLKEDRAKAAIYAAAGVHVYWVVDVAHDLVEVHTNIVEGRYSQVTTQRRGQSISLQAELGMTVAFDDILG